MSIGKVLEQMHHMAEGSQCTFLGQSCLVLCTHPVQTILSSDELTRLQFSRLIFAVVAQPNLDLVRSGYGANMWLTKSCMVC